MSNDLSHPEQLHLISEPRTEDQATPAEQAEQEAYREKLRLLLQDTAFRQTEGFPIGSDEAILALSDPPYYTACPNPFLGEIVERWQAERRELRQARDMPDDAQLPLMHTRQPFAADVSEGKNDPIYNAHSYHTKVPHKAIMRYILHYTDPGDVILDGFCGTGMTGVAAQLCGDKKTIESLGYTVKGSKVAGKVGQQISLLGTRKAILVDLSPAATFIAYNYNTPVNPRAFEKEARHILKEVEKECGWMYETFHADGVTKGRINFTIWSDVLACSQCGAEMVFWDVAVDSEENIHDSWSCPQCSTLLSKNHSKDSGALKVEHVLLTEFDRALERVIQRNKQVPVYINYSVGKKRYGKRPDKQDLELIAKVQEQEIPYWFPNVPMMFKGSEWGDTWRAGYHAGITHVHHFYTYRNLWVLAAVINKSRGRRSLFVITALLRTMSKMFRWAPGGKHTAGTSGTLYMPSITHEYSIFGAISRRLDIYEELLKMLDGLKGKDVVILTSDGANTGIPNNSIDYVFIDPPFGDNLMYSELNFITEAWLNDYTNCSSEAIVSTAQQKGLSEYQNLMTNCFTEFFRVLKPGHWMTIEFHNSKNSVWTAIQDGSMQAGFVVADVRLLDKQHNTFKQVNNTNAVKQDLVLSVYKPTVEFEKRFLSEAGTAQGAWEFIRQHLEKLPIPMLNDNVIEPVQERLPYLLYDRMVAFHIQRGLNVPLSASEFYQGLSQRFLERESMAFTPAQAAVYDKLRLQAERVAQLALFITDESSARQWIRQELDPATGHGSQTYGDLQPRFVQQLHKAKFEDLPELKVLLEQSFLQDAEERWYNPDPERKADLEALRQKALLREFNEYRKSKGRLKIFRSEAIRAGFSYAWRERQYDVIIEVAERMPESVLQEDQQLLMYYHNATLRHVAEPKQGQLF